MKDLKERILEKYGLPYPNNMNNWQKSMNRWFTRGIEAATSEIDIKAELLYQLIEKQKELIKLLREQSTYAGIYTFTELTDEIASLKKQIAKEKQCHAIYEKVKEAWTPDKRSFEEAEKDALEKQIEEQKLNLNQPIGSTTDFVVNLQTITDSDIEAWAKNSASNQLIQEMLAMGARAMRDNDIKHIEK